MPDYTTLLTIVLTLVTFGSTAKNRDNDICVMAPKLAAKPYNVISAIHTHTHAHNNAPLTHTHAHFQYTYQGTQTEEGGSVQLTSSKY